MKAKFTNISILILFVFIISLIITLNIFFQQSYQSEMAEQFNRQQLLVAKSVAINLENDMERLLDETVSFTRILAERGVSGDNIDEFINEFFIEGRDNVFIDVKLFDKTGALKYSSSPENGGQNDSRLFARASHIENGAAVWVDLLAQTGRIALVAPVWRRSEFLGALVVEIMIHDISRKFLAPIRAGIRGHTWMMNNKGTLLYHPTQPNMVGKNLFESDKSCFECHTSFELEKKILASGDIGFSSYIAPYGEDKLIAFSKARIGEMSWIVCVSTPYSEVMFSIRRSLKLHSLLVISIFIATVAGAFAVILINRQRVKAEEKAIHLEREKHLEQEILQTKDYLENILASTESKIMVLDGNMMIRTVNSAQEKLCSMRKDEIVGYSFFDVFPLKGEEEKEQIRKIFSDCLKGTSHKLSTYPYQRTDKMLFLNISINPLVLHGNISGIILSSSDITEEVTLREELKNYAARLEDTVRERTEELLQEKEKLNAIVETLEAGLFLVDNEKKITWINRKLREWLGEENRENISLDSIYGGHEIEQSIVDNQFMQEVIYHDLGRKKGYFQITSTPLVGSDGHSLSLVLIQDITEMKRAEEQMMRSEKISALSRISAGVAHEIGNPLTSISSYVQILREMDHDEFTRESLGTIAKHIKRITDIVRQMSSFSKTTATDAKLHEIRDLVQLTLDLVKYDKRIKNVSIEVDVPNDLPGVMVNDTQVIQVFMNIILNSADAMCNQGKLNIFAHRTDHEVEIVFADTGPGIPAEHIERIFDPFFTTKEMGTGLGLAVSYSIIKSYRGEIIAENKAGGGAIFKVRLPYRDI